MTRKNPFAKYEELGEVKVRELLAAGVFGSTGSPGHDEASSWLRLLDHKRSISETARAEAREERSLAISEEALRISRRANKTAISAIILSAATAIAVAIIQWLTKN